MTGMYSKRLRDKKMRETLTGNVKNSSFASEEMNESMFDYPMIDKDRVYEEVCRNVAEILQRAAVAAPNGAAGAPRIANSKVPSLPNEMQAETDSKYIVIEDTAEDSADGGIRSDKRGVKFYNPIQSSTQFKKAFDSGAAIRGIMPFHFQERLLIPKAGKQLSRKIHSNRFPGRLHIVLDSIQGYSGKVGSAAGLSVRIEVNGQTMETPICQEGKPADLESYMQIPIADSEAVKIKATLFVHRPPSFLFKGAVTPVAEAIFNLDKMGTVQNKLVEMAGQWGPVRHAGMLKNVKRLFYAPEAPAGNLKILVSYIAEDEVHTVSCEAPCSLYTLNKWLAIRQHVNNLLFAGYLTVGKTRKGTTPESQTIPDEYKKMYVKWYGFTIYMFDAYVKKLRGSINIADAELSCDDLVKGIISFRMDDGDVHVHCDTIEKLNGCMQAMSLLFPQHTEAK